MNESKQGVSEPAPGKPSSSLLKVRAQGVSGLLPLSTGPSSSQIMMVFFGAILSFPLITHLLVLCLPFFWEYSEGWKGGWVGGWRNREPD